MRAEDFDVDEIAAYDADGREGAHVLVRMRKRGLTTEDAVRRVAERLGIDRREIGVAGKKDRDAVTRQWITIPAAAAERLGEAGDDAVSLDEAAPHGNKLKTGHLHGNRFVLALRATTGTLAAARDKVAALHERGGLLNAYGGQRFGGGEVAVVRGLGELRRGRGGRRGNMVVAAGQAALFNLYLAMRHERGWLRRVLAGDLLQKTDTGGLFFSDDPAVDQARLDAGEVAITGPIYGSRMRAPPADSAAAALERDVLARTDISAAALHRLGRAALGTRRRLQVNVGDVRVQEEPAAAALPAGVRLSFALPAGAYATLLVREITGPA